ncbi:MAG TPA: diaminopimelate decarboxylase [Micavibrio sp.]
MSSGFHELDGSLYADGVALHDIASTTGTPTYVYSAGRLDENVQRLQNALQAALPPQAQPLIAYACKANSNIGVLAQLGRHGLGADVVSGGELMRARTAGIEGQKIVFSGVGKNDDDLITAMREDVAQINIESEPEFERILTLAQQYKYRPRIAFRMNPDVDAKTHAKITTGKEENKFGLPLADIERLYKVAAASDHVAVQGISVHIGSQLTTLAPFAEAFQKTAAFVQHLRAQGLPVQSIDLGGGLGIIYEQEQQPCLDRYAGLIRDIIHPLQARIILEPGRLIAGDAGLLLSRVTYVKRTAQRQYLILDAGMNDLVRPAMYDAYHPIRPVTSRTGDSRAYDIVGPVCETGDTFALSRDLPPVMAGDLMAIMVSGAYGFSMASRYNSRPLPAEVMTRAGQFQVVRPRENMRDILKDEAIPQW